MNAVLLAVLVMLALSLGRVHVVVALFVGAVVGGLAASLGLEGTMVAFQDGLAGGATIAISYALLGAFAMAVAATGLPQLLVRRLVAAIGPESSAETAAAEKKVKAGLILGTLAMAIASQNLIPVHIAFIPLLIPPLLRVTNRLRIDRRLLACVLTFGLITTYMFLPIGFGNIFLNEILLGNIERAGMDTAEINILAAMGIPALGMAVGLVIAVFLSYRKPRDYADRAIAVSADFDDDAPVSTYRAVIAVVAIVVVFAVQVVMQSSGTEASSLLVAALVGLVLMMATGAVSWRRADDVFTSGMRMMSLIGFIMIAAQGFAAVMTASGAVEPLVEVTADLFAGSKLAASFAMLLVGLIVTMGIGSSFSTLPIITTIYVPLCLALGFSPLATVSLIGTAGALGDAGSPASDSTLGPTAGLDADGQHDHIRDSVIPTFLHFNIPLFLAGWVAATVL